MFPTEVIFFLAIWRFRWGGPEIFFLLSSYMMVSSNWIVTFSRRGHHRGRALSRTGQLPPGHCGRSGCLGPWAPQRLPNRCSKMRRGAQNWICYQNCQGSAACNDSSPNPCQILQHFRLHVARSGSILMLAREQTNMATISLTSRRQMCGARPQRWQNRVRNLGMFGCGLNSREETTWSTQSHYPKYLEPWNCWKS